MKETRSNQACNTRINYWYRDGANYKVHSSCVINGRITGKQINTIIACLEDGEYFIPSLVGLPEVKFDEYDSDAAHPCFELDRNGFEHTRDEADASVSARDLVTAFIKVEEITADTGMTWADLSCVMEEYQESAEEEHATALEWLLAYQKYANIDATISIDNFASWIYARYTIGDNSMARELLENVLEYAEELPNSKQQSFLLRIIPQVPESVIRRVTF